MGLRFGDSIYMQSRFLSLLTPVGGWVVGKLESYAKLNSKLRLKLKLELNLAIVLYFQGGWSELESGVQKMHIVV